MNTLTHAQKWLDTSLYPFKSHHIQLEAGRMHYVDEGSGEVILFIHGTPTWSFLYRDMIKELSASHRCIAIDHLGFGLSESPEGFAGTPQAHARNLAELIERLGLSNITLVVHDFGGPIGLAAGIQHHERISRVVLFNTWLWATKDNPDALKIDRLINGWLGRTLYLSFNFSPKVLLKKGFHDKKKLTKAVHQHYIKPFPNKSSRIPLLSIAKSLVGSSDWYEEQWEQLELLEKKEWLILWGAKDQFITLEYLAKWRERLPNAQVRELESGHFVQEEKTMQSVNAIRSLISAGG